MTKNISKPEQPKKITFNFFKNGWNRPYVMRKEIAEFTCGLINANLMNNLDCAGKGPSERFKVGKHVAYPIDGLVSWLEARAKN